MPSPYDPYASLSHLLAAAGVDPGAVGLYTTAELLDLARRRTAPATPPPPAPSPGRRPHQPWATRSIRIPYDLERAADKKAKHADTNLNAVVKDLLEQWVHGTR